MKQIAIGVVAFVLLVMAGWHFAKKNVTSASKLPSPHFQDVELSIHHPNTKCPVGTTACFDLRYVTVDPAGSFFIEGQTQDPDWPACKTRLIYLGHRAASDLYRAEFSVPFNATASTNYSKEFAFSGTPLDLHTDNLYQIILRRADSSKH